MMYANIDLSDIPESKGKRKARKNPFYERIMKEGFTIREYYSPEDIKNIKKGNLARRIDICTLDAEELAAMEEYSKSVAIPAVHD
ncbi:MAG: hypothetical protein LBI27_05520 [Clostridiales bacterium]|nr:hypothetical protein [Clostridiales bacterium]